MADHNRSRKRPIPIVWAIVGTLIGFLLGFLLDLLLWELEVGSRSRSIIWIFTSIGFATGMGLALRKIRRIADSSENEKSKPSSS